MLEPQREQYDGFTLPRRAGAPDPGKRLIGYIVVWGATSGVRRDGFRHRYQRGSIQWADVVNVLWAGSYVSPLASTRNATLAIVEDAYGARATIDLDTTTDGRDALIRVNKGMVTGMDLAGTRISYKETATPGVIQIVAFMADTVSLTIVPGTIGFIATAQKFPQIQAGKQRARDSIGYCWVRTSHEDKRISRRWRVDNVTTYHQPRGLAIPHL